MLAASCSCGTSRTNDRSIFRMSTGRCFRRDSDEYPVPKSSMARRTPRPCSSHSTRCVRSGSVMAAVSVISTTMRAGSAPARSRCESTRNTRSGCHSWRGDRLNPVSRWMPSDSQIASWRATSATTQSPMASMRPISSASGMNSPGAIRPPRGSCHRSSALHAHDGAGREVHDRLVVQHPVLALDGLAQPGRQRQLADRAGALHRVDQEPAGAVPLALVQRRVGVAQQRVRVGRRRAGYMLMPIEADT